MTPLLSMISGARSFGVFGISRPPVSGMSVWLDASDINSVIFSSGSSIQSWNDKSGNSNHAVQSTSSYQPTHVTNILNNKPVVRFNGSNQFLTGPAVFNNKTSFSIFVVFIPRTLTANGDGYQALLTAPQASIDNGSFHYINPSGKGASYPMYNGSNAWGNYDNSFTYTMGQAHLLEFHAEGSNWNVMRDSVSEGSGSISGGISNQIAYQIAKQNSPTRYSAFDYAEILIYPTAVTSAQKTLTQQYLKSKWNTP